MLRFRRGAGLLSLAGESTAVVAAFFLALAIRAHHLDIPLLQAIPSVPLAAPVWPSRDYIVFLVVTSLLWPMCNRLVGTHEPRRRGAAVATSYLAGMLLCALLTGFLVFVFKLETVSRLFAGYFFTAGFLLLVAQRASSAALGRRLRRLGYGLRRIVVFGDGEEAAAAARAVSGDADGGYEVTGMIAALDCARPADLVREPLREKLLRADEALFVPSGRGMTEVEQVATTMFLLRGKRVHIVPRLLEDSGDRRLAALAELAVLSLGGPLHMSLRVGLRRAFDVIASGVLGAALLPVLLVLAALVKLDSSGPALFIQERLGRDGRPFRLMKLRTMIADAERCLREDPELYARYLACNYKLPDREDPRVTRIGSVLRRTGLDELPQLWNVLRGEMSLVGPRPVVPPELERYGDLAPLLLAVTPGITGPWQVSHVPPGYPRRARLDIAYVLNRSLRGDVGILLRTLPSLLRRRTGD